MIKEILRQSKPFDWILFSVLLVVSFSGLIVAQVRFPEGNTVIIEVDGKMLYRLSLDEDRTVQVRGPEGVTTVEISRRRVRVTDSPCAQKLCVRQGWIKRGVIICLPNKVVIKVGAPEERQTDAITG